MTRRDPRHSLHFFEVKMRQLLPGRNRDRRQSLQVEAGDDKNCHSQSGRGHACFVYEPSARCRHDGWTPDRDSCCGDDASSSDRCIESLVLARGRPRPPPLAFGDLPDLAHIRPPIRRTGLQRAGGIGWADSLAPDRRSGILDDSQELSHQPTESVVCPARK